MDYDVDMCCVGVQITKCTIPHEYEKDNDTQVESTNTLRTLQCIIYVVWNLIS